MIKLCDITSYFYYLDFEYLISKINNTNYIYIIFKRIFFNIDNFKNY